jgi:hypothetical protein
MEAVSLVVPQINPVIDTVSISHQDHPATIQMVLPEEVEVEVDFLEVAAPLPEAVDQEVPELEQERINLCTNKS